MSRKVVITHLDKSKNKEEVFAIAKRSKLLKNSIIRYSEDLLKQGIKTYERHINIIRTSNGYYLALYHQDLIKNRTKEPESKLEPFEGFDGRMKVKLMKEGEEIVEDLATIIAVAFIPNPDKYEFVKHKDGNTKNNVAENLYWSKIK